MRPQPERFVETARHGVASKYWKRINRMEGDEISTSGARDGSAVQRGRKGPAPHGRELDHPHGAAFARRREDVIDAAAKHRRRRGHRVASHGENGAVSPFGERLMNQWDADQ